VAPTNGNGNGNGRVSRWLFGIVLSVLLALIGWMAAWQVTTVEANAAHLTEHMAKQAEDERGYAERLRAVETDVRWIREYLERQGRK
jgi:5-bromo-4-chloroindolyl phosphate hydrolysis protein